MLVGRFRFQFHSLFVMNPVAFHFLACACMMYSRVFHFSQCSCKKRFVVLGVQFLSFYKHVISLKGFFTYLFLTKTKLNFTLSSYLSCHQDPLLFHNKRNNHKMAE